MARPPIPAMKGHRAGLQRVSPISAYGTKLAICIAEDFWLIVTPTRVKMSQKSYPHPHGRQPKNWSAIFAVPCASTIPFRAGAALPWKGCALGKALKILKNRGQRVSPSRFPFLLQSPSWASADVMDRRLSYDSEGLKLHWPETAQFFSQRGQLPCPYGR